MQLEVYEDTDLYSIEFDHGIDSVIFTWKEFASGERLRTGANALLEYCRNHDVSNLIIDTRGIKAHREEDKRWLNEEWSPKLRAAGIDRSCILSPQSAIAKMDRQEFEEAAADADEDVYWTDDMEEARSYMANAA